ncbi:L-threonylcarbamoyladenylate synthase [Actinomycetospora termitidis]|uniref:L-threonylcarbamoyladenylate synthase n=1 Tax=Actinomycetospora termitidis TaxID=3053470 RepID=A0ABT7M9G2_9PSEU|nr:L-threonylcarbamoyladenylate synthase [Actinomycetospora sp. Odt1-22]MDL5157091.1 L-threonylcarbamoyladenylate synthase [Actinomycetospora sp. Odt1-22]
MTTFDCRVPDTRSAGLAAAASAVRSGRLVVVPTDTSYGVGADAFDQAAVAELLRAKRRGAETPVPVLVGSWSTIDGLVTAVPTAARDLVEAFWPGGLSLVLPHAPSLAWDLGRTRGTVVLRMPLHPVALELLRECGPMAITGANAAGRGAVPHTCADAYSQLGDLVSVYLDGGELTSDAGSTIVDLTGSEPVVRREGTVTTAQIAEVLGRQPAVA